MILSASKKITLGAMVVTLNVVTIYIASIIPTMRIACYFISALYVYSLADVREYVIALLSFFVSITLCYFLLPDKMSVLPYAVILGHYGIFKCFMDGIGMDRIIVFVLKMIYCNIFVGAALYIAVFILKLPVGLTELMSGFPVWLPVIIAEAVFIAFELIYSICVKIYVERIKSIILPRK